MPVAKVARRAFLRGAAAIGLAAPTSGAVSVAQQRLSPGLGAVAGQVGSPSSGVDPWVRAKMTKLGWQRLCDRRERLEEEHGIGVFYRLNGLDPDLYALQSTSHAWKVGRQRQRDRELARQLRRMTFRIWPKED